MDALRWWEELLFAHRVATNSDRTLDDNASKIAKQGSTPFHMFGVPTHSQVGLAAGFDKNGEVPLALQSLGFGFLELGTVTNLSQAPNPSPNLFRLPLDRALINRLGFPNQGARAFRETLQPKRSQIKVPLGISIGKSRAIDVEDEKAVLADYLACFREVRALADFVVVNVSSPNTVGLRSLQSIDRAKKLLETLQEANRDASVPLLLKVAPDLPLEEAALLFEALRENEWAGVVATNTTLSREGLRTEDSVVRRIGAGGLSGPPVFSKMLSIVSLARSTLGRDATIIGVGGITTGDDAKRVLEAGANFIQVYTALIYEGPSVARRLTEHLAKTARSS